MMDWRGRILLGVGRLLGYCTKGAELRDRGGAGQLLGVLLAKDEEYLMDLSLYVERSLAAARIRALLEVAAEVRRKERDRDGDPYPPPDPTLLMAPMGSD